MISSQISQQPNGILPNVYLPTTPQISQAPITRNITVPTITVATAAQLTGTNFTPWDNTNSRRRDEYFTWFETGQVRLGTSGVDLTAISAAAWSEDTNSRSNLGWAVEFVANTTSLEWDYRLTQAGNFFRVYINGQVAISNIDPAFATTVKDIFDSSTAAAAIQVGSAKPGSAPGVAGSGNWANGDHAYLTMSFTTRSVVRVRIEASGRFGFYGVRTDDTTGSIQPAPKQGRLTCITFGDSLTSGSHASTATYGVDGEWSGYGFVYYMCRMLGWEHIGRGIGGTGHVKNQAAVSSFLIGDRIVPPVNTTWRLTNGVTAGPITITYNGQTTGSITYSATSTTFITNINAALLTTFGSDSFGRPNVYMAAGFLDGNTGTERFMFLSRLTGGTTTTAPSSSGGTGSFNTFALWTGDCAPQVPTDGNGNQKPFIIFIEGGWNDKNLGASDANIAGAVGDTIDRIKTTFPTATIIMMGNAQSQNSINNATGLATTDNAVYNACLTHLPKINGFVPFISMHKAVLDTPSSLYTYDWLNGYDGYTISGDNPHWTFLGHQYVGLKCAETIQKWIL